MEKEIEEESVEKIEKHPLNLLEKDSSKEKLKQKTEKGEKKPFPWILALLAVILIIFAGLAIQKVLSEQEIKQGEWDIETEKTIVEIKSFYSSECGFCDKENSVIANFKSRDININVELIDLSKEENKHYITEFGIKRIPTALVKAKDLEDYPFIENLIKEAFTEKNDYYIIPESYLDSVAHNIMLLDALECDSGEGKVIAEQFCDYQTLGCALIFDSTKNARENFAGELIYKYKNYLLHGEQSKTTALVAECAREQGRFFGFNKYLYEKSFPQAFGIEKDPVDNSVMEVINAGLFVTQIEDINSFRQCLEKETPMQKIQDENVLAIEYGVHYTPSLVLDCKYIIQGNENINKTEEIICELHPELKGCKETE